VIDTHTHLDPADAAAVLERAREAGVDRVVAVGTTLAGCAETLSLARRFTGVSVALGIHPHEAASDDAAHVEQLRALFADEHAVAVGETGLDYARDYAPVEAQRRLFDAHIALAAELGLALVIHSRDADDDTLAALASFTGTVVLHCFSSPAMLDTALERGYYISFAGNVTFPNAGALRDAAQRVPGDRLLLETDSPYLAPQPVRGQRNEPAYVVHTLATVAEARGEPAAALGAQVDANATAAFSL
jgi:TatD DNase family protein